MKIKYSILFFGLFTISLHLLSLNFFPINYEYTFSEGSKYFNSFESKYSEFYFKNQANTLFYSLIINFIDRITLGTIESLVISRLISFSSYIFLIYGLFYHLKFFKIHKSLQSLVIILFLFNPIVWTLSFRSTPDLISSALGFYASGLLLYKFKNIRFRRASYLMLGASIALKPFAFIYLLYLICFVDFKKIPKFNKKYFIDLVFLLIIPFIYYFSVKYFFGFYLLSDHFASDHELKKNIKIIIQNFIGYFCFLSIFIFPLTFSIKRRIGIKIIILYLLTVVIGVYYLNFLNSGELNFGFFGLYFHESIFLFISFSSFFIFLLKIYEILEYTKNKFLFNKIIILLLLFIFILSLSKPVQRYLIFILPIIFILFVNFIDQKKIKYLMVIGILLYFPINILSFINSYYNSKFYNNMFLILKQNEIEKITDFKTLDHAFGFLYLDNQLSKKYYITREAEDYFLKFQNTFFGFKTNYYLINKKN